MSFGLACVDLIAMEVLVKNNTALLTPNHNEYKILERIQVTSHRAFPFTSFLHNHDSRLITPNYH